MPLPAEIAALVETFAAHEDAYTAPEFKEAQVRQQFIDPLFAALGWDVANTAGYAEAYKEVIHEDALKIGGETKAPDYSFRIGGNRKFFVEAKKPAVLIKDHPEPAYQLRRYSWSAKLPLGILTDFQEFAVYDTRVKPAPTDKASAARLFYCRYDELEKHWDFIAGTFAKEAVLKGSFDKYAAATKGKRGTATVDDAFLGEIETWRDRLARNLALRNPALDVRGLNFAVQRIIDRLVFLRIAEDRGNEPFGQLQALLAGPKIYPRLVEIFEKADYRYNSGLFHFAQDADCAETPDTLTPGLAIDDAVLKDILGSLYYPQSPYVFTVLPAYILGHVYEQFLGKVIRLTEGHQAKVEEKPEVRKAGGVYYTPQYIVDYIVQKTVGPLVQDATPKRIETLAVLDPACGSGTFLLGAYDYLLGWYLRHYSENAPEKWAKQGRIYETAPNAHLALGAPSSSSALEQGTPLAQAATPPAARSWALTTAERKRILLAHIHGVDIDAAAVEVTKLSLLLKVLEGERREFQGRTREMAAVLPDLSRNIQCGNSLIGHDFYAQPDLPALDAEAKYKLNTFEWKDGFPAVMKRGGFDAVIGNPPYIRIQTMTETSPESVGYLSSRYKSAAAGNYDIYVCFVERALELLNKDGLSGYILPHKFFNAEYGDPVRRLIAQNSALSDVVHFGAEQVFEGATTYCCLLFLSSTPRPAFAYTDVRSLDAWRKNQISFTGTIPSSELKRDSWNFAVGPDAKLITRLRSHAPKLGDLADIFVGLQTSADKVLILDVVSRGKKRLTLFSKSLNEAVEIEPDFLRPLLSGAEVQGYAHLVTEQVILFPYSVKNETASLLSLDLIAKAAPLTAAYLLKNQKTLEDRESGKFKGNDWHRFGRSQNLGIQERPKLCVPRLVDRLCASLDAKGAYFLDNVDVGGVTLKPSASQLDLRYIQGLLNSRLVGWFFPNVSAPFRGGWMSANRQFLSQVPIALPKDKAAHDKLVVCVDAMLALHRAQAAAQSPHEKESLAKQITATDRQIDALVYQLYGLTPDEIALVEGTAS